MSDNKIAHRTILPGSGPSSFECNHCPMSERALLQENDRLRRYNKSLLDGIAFTGHEWRNRIARLSIAIEKLPLEPGSPFSGQQKATIERIRENTKALRSIATNYLSLAKLEQNGFVLQPSYIDLAREILTPLLADYTDLAADNEQICQIRTSAPGMLVWADKELFTSVWENLLNNAIKYGETGGKIVLGLAERGTEYEFNVWNSGPGVQLCQTEHIFERFVVGTNRTPTTGTGIGLYLARKIIEAHQGCLWVESMPGAWVNFVFTLPRRETAEHKRLSNEQDFKNG